jgi:polyhydroxyalkanoate synthesis regulator phasin
MRAFARATCAGTLTLLLACASSVFGQKADPQSQDLNIRAYIELLRSDLRGQKVAVIAEVMSFTEDEGVKFWPIYQEYQGEMAKLMDRKLAGIKDYAVNYEKMTQEKAKEITDLALQLESDRVGVKKKYIDRMRQALSSKTAGRFLQVENQIQFLMDLQIASSLPVVQ